MYISDWSGVHWHEEDLEIEDVMETPEVGVGDLLLLSLNTIHATQTTDDRRLAVSLRTCDPETPIDWHRVAGSPTPRMMKMLASQNKLFFPVFQHIQENNFGITLADVLPTLTVASATENKVAGYSAFFTQLNKPLQDGLIARTEYRL